MLYTHTNTCMGIVKFQYNVVRSLKMASCILGCIWKVLSRLFSLKLQLSTVADSVGNTFPVRILFSIFLLKMYSIEFIIQIFNVVMSEV
jgi:hypothetical protein